MIIIILWIITSFYVAGVFGTTRTIGPRRSLFISLLLSPVIGLPVTLFFKSTGGDLLQKKRVDLLKNPILSEDIHDQLELLAILKYEESITDAEYHTAKTKLLA